MRVVAVAIPALLVAGLFAWFLFAPDDRARDESSGPLVPERSGMSSEPGGTGDWSAVGSESELADVTSGMSSPEVDGPMRTEVIDSLGLRVVDASGLGVEAARLIFVPWHTSGWALGSEGVLGSTVDLAATSEVLETDAGGQLVHLPDAVALELAPFGSALWVAKPGYRVAVRVAGHGDASPLSDGPIALERAASTRVRVVGPGGAPVADARVVARLAAFSPTDGRTRPMEVYARALFHWIGVAGADGSCDLPAPPIDPAGPGQSLLVRAIAEDHVSPWVEVATGASVELSLEPSFSLVGNVLGAEPWLGEFAVPPAIVVERRRGGGWGVVGSTALRIDASFGPIEIPFSEDADYRVRIDGGTCLPGTLSLSGARAGATLEVTLEARTGLDLVASVFGADSGERLDAAQVTVDWMDLEGRDRRSANLSEHDGLRYHVAGGLPAGIPLTLTARVDGYASRSVRGIVLPDESAQYQTLRLSPSRTLRGLVLGLDPVPEQVDLLVADGADTVLTRETVALDREGRFELGVASTEARLCRAITFAGGVSEPAAIAAGDSPHVELRFSEPATVQGQVVDLESGLVPAGATVQVVLEGAAGDEAVALSDLIAIESNGHFAHRIGPNGGGQVSLVVDAPGYSRREVTAALEVPVTDFGRVAIAGALGVELQFRSANGTSLEGAQVLFDGGEGSVKRPVDGTGAVGLAGLAMGEHRLELRDLGDRPRRWVWVTLRPEVDSIVVPYDGPGELRLSWPPVAGSSSEELWVEIDATTESVGQLLRYVIPSGESRFDIDDLPVGEWRVELIDPATRAVVADSRVSITPLEPSAQVELAVQLPPIFVRVLGASGEPESGAKVVARDVAGNVFSTGTLTDAEGVAEIPVPDVDAVLIDVLGASGSTAMGVDVAGAPIRRGRANTVDVRLADEASVELRLVDPDRRPLESVSLSLTNANHVTALREGLRSDASGVVRVDGLGAGACGALIVDPRFVPMVLALEASTDPAVREVVLFRRSELSITVRGVDGDGLSGVSISVRHAAFGTHGLEGYADYYGIASDPPGFATDAAGKARLSGLPEGELEVELSSAAEVRRQTLTLSPAAVGAFEVDW